MKGRPSRISRTNKAIEYIKKNIDSSKKELVEFLVETTGLTKKTVDILYQRAKDEIIYETVCKAVEEFKSEKNINKTNERKREKFYFDDSKLFI